MSRKALLPVVVALAGAFFPLLSRAASDDFKGAYGDASSSASGSASAMVSVSASALLASSSASEMASVTSSSSASGAASLMPTAPPPIVSASAIPSSSASPRPKAPLKEDEDPLVVPEGIRDDIGSSYPSEDRPEGPRVRSGLFPLVYSERIKGELTTAAFPFYYDRREFDASGKKVAQQSFYTLYYRKRSTEHDVDAIFPLLFRWRDFATTTTIVPPVLWRDGPNEWHRWLAPLFFASSQPDGGYFHAPFLLTFSHHNPKRAFSLIGGLGFYDRTNKNVDFGAVPFFFGGYDDDKLTSYFLIPPLLTYHSVDRDFEISKWVIGPVYSKTTPNSAILDVFPLFLHNHGEDYTSTTVLPLFHSSRNKDKRLLVTPLFLRAEDKDGTTFVTPFYSQYRGRTTLDLAGPIIPLFAHYRDPDIYKESWLIGPVYSSHDPTGYTFLTPLFGQFREYGVSNTTWVFPTFEHETRVDGWSFNVHPLFYLGHDGPSWHSVLAPIWWDFVSPKRRTTVAFPVFWRFRDEEGTTQVAGNTLYIDHPTSKGSNYDFYFLPIFHVGEQPNGHVWDVLFGLVGYKRVGGYKQLKLFWIPIDLTHNPDDDAANDKKKHSPVPLPPSQGPGGMGVPHGPGGGGGGGGNGGGF